MTTPTTHGPTRDEASGWVFWTSFVLGWSLIAFGIWTGFQKARSVHPVSVGTWFVGLTLAHDLVVAPAVSALGIVLLPRLPRRVRGAVLVALIVSASFVLVSLPPLLGDPGDNPTLLPRNYAAGIAVALSATWAVTAAWIVAARVRRTR